MSEKSLGMLFSVTQPNILTAAPTNPRGPICRNSEKFREKSAREISKMQAQFSVDSAIWNVRLSPILIFPL